MYSLWSFYVNFFSVILLVLYCNCCEMKMTFDGCNSSNWSTRYIQNRDIFKNSSNFALRVLNWWWRILLAFMFFMFYHISLEQLLLPRRTKQILKTLRMLNPASFKQNSSILNINFFLNWHQWFTSSPTVLVHCVRTCFNEFDSKIGHCFLLLEM